VEQWGLAGLLHDFDYERWPDSPQHTREGAAVLRKAGCDEEVIGAILSHTPWNLEEYPRDRPIRKTLFAADELCGFIYAAALIRPQRMEGMEPRGVAKKLKQKAFAAAVSREDINEGVALLGLPLEEHIGHCLEAIWGIRKEVDLMPAGGE
jgi:predicted hydrolase (HD superfamily)